MTGGSERGLFLATLLLALTLATPLKDSNGVATLVAVEGLAHGRLSLGPGGDVVGDRAWVPSRPSSAAAALGGAAGATLPLVGRAYHGNAPGAIFLWAPIHVVARRVLPERLLLLAIVCLGAALPHAIGTVGVRRAVLRATGCREDEATLAAFAYGLGTIALPLSTRAMSHSVALPCLAWSLALALRRDTRGAAGAGALAAVAFTCHYVCALPAAILGVVTLLQGGMRCGAAFALGASPVLGALGLYNAHCFGSPLTTAYGHRYQPDLRALLEKNAGFSYPRPAILAELFFGTRRGVIFTQPVVLVGVVGLVAMARQRDRTALLALACVALLFLVNAGRPDWAAGYSFGSRYTSGALPFVALGLPRGFALAGAIGKATLGASVALAVGASATNWGFSSLTTLGTLLRLGPRTMGLADVLLGAGDHETTGHCALVAAAALAVALPVAATLLGARAIESPARRRAALFALALAPLLLCLPIAATLARSGPPGVVQAHRSLLRREMLSELETVWHAQQARRMAESAQRSGDPLVYTRAIERTVELDPADEGARNELARLKALLRR